MGRSDPQIHQIWGSNLAEKSHRNRAVRRKTMGKSIDMEVSSCLAGIMRDGLGLSNAKLRKTRSPWTVRALAGFGRPQGTVRLPAVLLEKNKTVLQEKVYLSIHTIVAFPIFAYSFRMRSREQLKAERIVFVQHISSHHISSSMQSLRHSPK